MIPDLARLLFATAVLLVLTESDTRASAAMPQTETVEQALCRLIDEAARTQQLPAAYLTRLIWQESSFRTSVVSPVGAQGVAQFMPGTAKERGLADPFDPEQAIPAAAALLRDLSTRFGNLGLAAAAYNGGRGRVEAWLAGRGGLPTETRTYVERITGRSAEDWAADRDRTEAETGDHSANAQTCSQVAAVLRRRSAGSVLDSPIAPWGVQLAGNFSKAIALASFARARAAYSSLLREVRPMIIGTRLRTRGARTHYRVRAPAATREAANSLCNRLRASGGSCIVLRS